MNATLAPNLINSRFLKTLQLQPSDAKPVWFMRQAGRYMPQYRALRERVGMLESIYTPEVALEITLQPLDAFDLDAGIVFSDILIPLIGMGLNLEFVGGVGPRLHNPVRDAASIGALRTPAALEALEKPLAAIRLISQELARRNLPLIGFAGAPFTLASYMIEGGGSKNYEHSKALMYQDEATWNVLMAKLEVVLIDFLCAQVEAGAAVLQLFESWGGALSPQDFKRFVLPTTERVLLGVRNQHPNIPIIYFSQGTSHMLPILGALPCAALSLDWRADWTNAVAATPGKALQGNLDPLLLFAPWPELKQQATQILQAAPRVGHVFNLGHGILPGTPLENVARLVDFVHEFSANQTVRP